MILINPLGIIVLLILAAPYMYGWLRIEIYFRVREIFDEMVADAWAMPKYKHYLLYLRVKFVLYLLSNPGEKTDEDRFYIEEITKRLFEDELPKYVLEASLMGGKHSKIKSLWQWATWQIEKMTRLKWRV